ncbi:MAG TPA: hypothetical protein VL863_03290 [bacterium]|nr:hypothetical protein [bacterium]
MIASIFFILLVYLCARPANYRLAHEALATAMPTKIRDRRKMIFPLFYTSFKRSDYFWTATGEGSFAAFYPRKEIFASHASAPKPGKNTLGRTGPAVPAKLPAVS